MKSARVAAAALALLAMPTSMVLVPAARAQMPNINLIPDLPTKSQEEKDADEAREKAYRDSLKKIPDAKASSDPWGAVRSDTPKATTAPAPKATGSAKKTKTGSAN